MSLKFLDSYPLRAQVEGCNNDRLKALETPSFTYHSMDSRGYDTKGTVIEEDTAKRSLDRLVAINEISLKARRFSAYSVGLIHSFKLMTGRGSSYVN